jgi:hypothetical protein
MGFTAADASQGMVEQIRELKASEGGAADVQLSLWSDYPGMPANVTTGSPLPVLPTLGVLEVAATGTSPHDGGATAAPHFGAAAAACARPSLMSMSCSYASLPYALGKIGAMWLSAVDQRFDSVNTTPCTPQPHSQVLFSSLHGGHCGGTANGNDYASVPFAGATPPTARPLYSAHAAHDLLKLLLQEEQREEEQQRALLAAPASSQLGDAAGFTLRDTQQLLTRMASSAMQSASAMPGWRTPVPSLLPAQSSSFAANRFSHSPARLAGGASALALEIPPFCARKPARLEAEVGCAGAELARSSPLQALDSHRLRDAQAQQQHQLSAELSRMLMEQSPSLEDAQRQRRQQQRAQQEAATLPARQRTFGEDACAAPPQPFHLAATHSTRPPNSMVASPMQSMRTLQVAQQQTLQTVARPSTVEVETLFCHWQTLSAEVAALALERAAHWEIQPKLPSHRSCCVGCGASKLGHKRSGMHSKCREPLCHCGLHRLLHPAPLAAGPECRGEWRDLLAKSGLAARKRAIAPPPTPPMQMLLPMPSADGAQ